MKDLCAQTGLSRQAIHFYIQQGVVPEGKKTGQISLHFGADDFGGTLFEENVHLATGHLNKTTIAEVETASMMRPWECPWTLECRERRMRRLLRRCRTNSCFSAPRLE